MTVALPTRADYFQVGAQDVFARSAARPKAQRISPQAVYTEGTDINIILGAASAMADEATRHLAMRIAALYLDSAEDEDLDRLVADRVSPELFRKQAAPSVVQLQFTRSAPPSTLIAQSYDLGRKFRTDSGVEFKLTEPVALPAGSTGPVWANAEALLSGTGGNVVDNTVRRFVQTPTDSAVQVTNPEAAAGGRDVETNEQFRERARGWFRTARRGTLDAIEFGALTVPGVASAKAEEVIDPNTGMPTGPVRAYIADSNGQSNAILAESVRLVLREYRAAGVAVSILSSKPQFVSIAYRLAFGANVDTRAAIAQLKRLTVATVNLLGPNEPLLRSMLFALARAIPGAVVASDAVQLPGGDLIPASGLSRSFKTSLDLVTVNGL